MVDPTAFPELIGGLAIPEPPRTSGCVVLAPLRFNQTAVSFLAIVAGRTALVVALLSAGLPQDEDHRESGTVRAWGHLGGKLAPLEVAPASETSRSWCGIQFPSA